MGFFLQCGILCFLFSLKVALACIDGNCRILAFPGPFFFDHKRLVNHTIRTEDGVDFDICQLLCYHDDNCVSINYDLNTKRCELNNATHRRHDDKFVDKSGYFYHGADSACDVFQCKNNGTCQSGFTDKRYRCLCVPGFTGEKCEKDIDECTSGTHNCSSYAVCNNTDGSYNCTCKPGYSGNGRNCTDFDECAADIHNCSSYAVCNNTKGSHNCSCKPGYSGNGRNCTDIDECDADTHNCSSNAVCNNTKGSYICSCKPGHTGDGQNCTDINECEAKTHNCNVNAACSNTKGSFNCTCEPGYIGDGHNCTVPIPRYETIGCFRDNQQTHAIATLEGQDSILDGDYKTRKDAVDKCSQAAKKREFHVFAVQDGGMCLANATAHQTFHQYGRSDACETDGEGGLGANQVYYITGYDTVGCYKDSKEYRAIPTLEGKDPILDRPYKERENPITKCAVAALKAGYCMFAVQDGGWCAASATAHQAYNKYGKATDCKADGEGGPEANQVYVIKD